MFYRFYTCCAILRGVAALSLLVAGPAVRAETPPFDTALWTQYRGAVPHPAVAHTAADVARARENLRRYAWARDYQESIEARVRPWKEKLTPEFLEQMIPTITPGVTNFTPCPACRDQKRPMHPHGEWEWAPESPDRIVCVRCRTAFPNDQYPESVQLTARWPGAGREQTFTYYGGEPFRLFQFPAARPSFTGYIRARKVLWAVQLVRDLAEAYTLTGQPEYADAARRILLRFADVYPRYLVHSGYGEVADGDPHATVQTLALPADELVPAPAEPDRKLHTGFWTAGRATGSGMEGTFVARVTEAYDLTCAAKWADGKPVYSPADRLHVERDLLFEGTYLLAADPALNNKSVANASAVALVGMTLGQPEMVRFGLRSFEKTLGDYFPPDGGPSESWSYSLMTLNGIADQAQALRGYSDPPGWRDADGKRMDGFDPYRLPAYRRVWEAMLLGLQGNLLYPPLADGHRDSQLGARFTELAVAAYPDDTRFAALLRETAGADLARGDGRTAIYLRRPGLESTAAAAPSLALPDHLFTATGLGYLRDGLAGRDGALVLSASDWGTHHHEDSLGLYWWSHGRELLSDLGYLWDHPDKRQTARTAAHNTALIDDADQATKGRGGRFVLFRGGNGATVRVMEAESDAYAPKAQLYRRTVARIGDSTTDGYVLDLFRLQGGAQHSLVFHGPNEAVSGAEKAVAVDGVAAVPAAYDLSDARRLAPTGAEDVHRLTWQMSGNRQFSALWPGNDPEEAWIGKGWGQRDYHNTDRGATLPYVVRRRAASPNVPTVFVTVYEEYTAGRSGIAWVRRLPVSDAERDNTVMVAVGRADGGVDYVVSCREARTVTVDTPHGALEFTGRFAALRLAPGKEGKLTSAHFAPEERLRWQNKTVKPGR